MVGADFLQLHPSTAPPRGLRTWLTAALRAAVADGRLPVGARLPATRGLAAELGVSRGVVVDAYERLVDEGVLAGHRRWRNHRPGCGAGARPISPGPLDHTGRARPLARRAGSVRVSMRRVAAR